MQEQGILEPLAASKSVNQSARQYASVCTLDGIRLSAVEGKRREVQPTRLDKLVLDKVSFFLGLITGARLNGSAESRN